MGEATREMLIEAARIARGSHEFPQCLRGPTLDYSHARYLPEDRYGDGINDHLTVLASGAAHLVGSVVALKARLRPLLNLLPRGTHCSRIESLRIPPRYIGIGSTNLYKLSSSYQRGISAWRPCTRC